MAKLIPLILYARYLTVLQDSPVLSCHVLALKCGSWTVGSLVGFA